MELEPGFYLHYKGHRYYVLGVAKHSESTEKFAVYSSSEDEGLFIRPLEMFMETVEYDGQQIPRFKYLGRTL